MPTDIAAGLILVQEYQKRQPLQFTLQPITAATVSTGNGLSPPSSIRPVTADIVIEQQPQRTEVLVNIEEDRQKGEGQNGELLVNMEDRQAAVEEKIVFGEYRR